VIQRVQTAVPIFLLVVLAIVVTNVFPFRQMIANDRTIDLGIDRLEELHEENARLTLQVEALATEGEVERLAREDLGYVQQGEITYVITNPANPVVVESVEVALPEEVPWYKSVWNFLSGQDFVGTQF
jgi:cell division protein FtsB